MSPSRILYSTPSLSLREASQKVGVTPATLRQWANQGRVQSFRTPGGHRRFSASEISALTSTSGHTSGTNPRAETLVHSALGRARLDIGQGRLEKTTWYQHFDEPGREIHRKLGRQLMTLLVRVLRGDESERELAREARKLGQEYGRTNIRENIQLTDALRAFLFFRDYVFEDLIGFSLEREDNPESKSIDRYRRASHFVNEILVAMVETFSRGKRTK